MTVLAPFTLPGPQKPFSGDPAGDANQLVAGLLAAGAGSNVLNTAAAFGGADTTGARDSTPAFTAAASGGGHVTIPPGRYLLGAAAAAALAAVGTVLAGSGKGVTTLVCEGPAIAVTADFCGVYDLSMVGPTATVAANPAGDAITVTGGRWCQVRDVFFQYVNGRVVYSAGSAAAANIGCRFDRLTYYNCAGGIHIQGVAGSGFGGQQWITHPHGSQIGVAGGTADVILVEDASDVWVTGFDGAISDAGTGAALRIRGASSAIHVTDLDAGAFPNTVPANMIVVVEDSANGSPSDVKIGGTIQAGLTGLQVTGGASRLSLAGLAVKNCQADGVVLAGSGSGIELAGVIFSGNGAGGSGTNHDLNITGTCTGKAHNCHFLSPVTTTGTPGVQLVAGIASSGQAFPFTDCEFIGTGSAPSLIFANLPSYVRDCKGYNPKGAVVVAVPASAGSTAGLHFDAVFYITAAAGGPVSVTRGTSGQGGGTGPAVTIPAGQLAAVPVMAGAVLTYTYGAGNAPTQVVDGQ